MGETAIRELRQLAKVAGVSELRRSDSNSPPLIGGHQNCSRSALEDLLMLMAHTVEKSMGQAGAIPGRDYTILDLYKLGQPFALEIFRRKECGVDFPIDTMHGQSSP